MFESAHQL